MKSAKAWAIFLVFLLWMTAGCANYLASLQVAEYVNQGILMIAELEQKSLQRYASVVGENYTTDTAVYEALNEFVIPVYGRFVDELRKIRPETDELKQLHKLYVQGAESIYSGFRMKLAGIEKQDEPIIRSANEKIEEGRIKTEAWRKDLAALYQKYGRKG